MLKNKVRGKRVYTTHYELEFVRDYGMGLEPCAGFETGPDFKLDVDSLNEWQRANYESCIAGENGVVPTPIKREYETSYWEDGHGTCECGREVYLQLSLVNECECGREYNASGQQLAHRSRWGDDTGESVSEILQGNVLMGGDY